MRPKYPNFWSKLHIFVPSGQLEPHGSMLSTRKRFPDMGVLKVLVPRTPKNRFLAQKRPNLAQIDILGQILVFLAHLIPCPTQKCKQGTQVVFRYVGKKNFLTPTKTMRTSCLSGFLRCGYQNFCSLPK